jgi:hypothetical protein
MFNKFKRTNFLSKVETISGSNEYDLLSSNWDLFEINYPISINTVQVLDINRPDYLSTRIYGGSEFWWILCKFNHIDDIWNDMYVGKEIVVPNMQDIIEFNERVKKRFRK